MTVTMPLAGLATAVTNDGSREALASEPSNDVPVLVAEPAVPPAVAPTDIIAARAAALSAERDPAEVYLSGLPSGASRDTMSRALRLFAGIVAPEIADFD